MVTLEMTYFRVELVQQIVSQSDSELVLTYGINKKILWLLNVDPIMLKRNCEQDNVKNRPQTAKVGF